MRIPSLGEIDLLLPLHEGVFEQPMWHTFLERLRAESGADCAALIFCPVDSSASIQLNSGDADLSQWVNSQFFRSADGDRPNPRAMREGRVHSLEEFAEFGGQSAPAGTDGAAGGVTSMRALRLRDASDIDTWLILASQRDLGPQIANLLVTLTPHIRAAMRVLAVLERERTRASMSAELFNRMNFGWISLDARCQIVDHDKQAERFLRHSGTLRRGPYDRLTPTSPKIDRQLSHAVSGYTKDRRARPRAINLSQDPWVDILVSPVRVNALSGDGNAVAVIYVRGDRSSTADRCDQLVDLFDLTRSEARLAWSMAQGLSIAESADQHGLTIETARNYSKKIYVKTGARGQVELVRHILTSVLALA